MTLTIRLTGDAGEVVQAVAELRSNIQYDDLGVAVRVVGAKSGYCLACRKRLTAGDKTLGNCGSCKTPTVI